MSSDRGGNPAALPEESSLLRSTPRTSAIEEILARPLVAVIGTRGPDGGPHLTAVWFAPAGEQLHVIARSDARKVANIAADPRVQVCVNAGRTGPCATAEGTAELAGPASWEQVHDMAVRYLGPEGAAGYMAKRPPEAESVLISVQPRRWRYWAA